MLWGSISLLGLTPLILPQTHVIIKWFLLNYTGLHILKLIDYYNRYESLPEYQKRFWKFFHSFDHLYTTNITKCLPRGACTLSPSAIFKKFLAGTLYGALGAGLLSLNLSRGWWKISPVVDYAMLGLEYYLFFVFIATLMVSVYRTIGYEVSEFFETPLYALSPGEFWRRWNKPMQEWLMDNVFNQVMGRKRLYTGIILTFAASGLFHEYTISLASDTINGFMLAYFLLQSGAYLLSIYLHHVLSGSITDYEKRKDIIVIKWASTMASLTVPGVLFIHNLRKVFPLHEF